MAFRLGPDLFPATCQRLSSAISNSRVSLSFAANAACPLWCSATFRFSAIMFLQIDVCGRYLRDAFVGIGTCVHAPARPTWLFGAGLGAVTLPPHKALGRRRTRLPPPTCRGLVWHPSGNAGRAPSFRGSQSAILQQVANGPRASVRRF